MKNKVRPWCSVSRLSVAAPVALLTLSACIASAADLAPAAASPDEAMPAPVRKTVSPAKSAPDRAALERQEMVAREAEITRLMDFFSQAQRRGDVAEASSAVSLLSSLLPPDSVALSRRAAWVEQMRGNADGSRRLLGRILNKLPDDLNATMNLALLDAREGKVQDAVTRLRKLKLIHPEATEVDTLLLEIEGRSIFVARPPLNN